jgi:hypothetical protein
MPNRLIEYNIVLHIAFSGEIDVQLLTRNSEATFGFVKFMI